MLNRDANSRFLAGQGITYTELSELQRYYEELESILMELDDVFYLARQEVNRRLFHLYRYNTVRDFS